MTAIVRSLPGFIVEGDRPTAPIPVRQIVDHDQNEYTVHLDVTEHISLIKLAKAMAADPAALAEWKVLLFNENGPRRVGAQAVLTRNTKIRDAFTIALTPAEAGNAADSLAERLEQAALEPAHCQWWDGCDWFTVGEEDFCEVHLADVAEHGPLGDRGSYDYGDEAS